MSSQNERPRETVFGAIGLYGTDRSTARKVAWRQALLVSAIIETFPSHHTYVEPFGGAASVLLNKPIAAVEVYNDLDLRITRLFRVLRDHGPELQRRLSLTPYSEAEFREAQAEAPDEIEAARPTLSAGVSR